MNVKSGFTLAIFASLMLFFPAFTRAQKLDFPDKSEPFKRIRPAPESVFKLFREAGMNPVNRELTPAQKDKVKRAFALLPPLHQRIVKQHLHSISFMDNMPNTALTSPVDSGGRPKLFTITFRANLLDETISEWASTKENTCFKRSDDANYTVRVEGGDRDAILYVLMHEATHIVDAVMNLTPHPNEKEAVVQPTPFTNGIWRKMNVPDDKYLDSLLEKTRFRSGKPMAMSLAPDVYRKLGQTPYPSLYGMAAWFEDIAELATIYHLTTKLNQPFYVVVTKDNVELTRFEPMKSKLAKQRLKQLAIFYAN